MGKNKNMKKMTEEQRQALIASYNTNIIIKPKIEEIKEEEKDDKLQIDENLKSPVISFMGHVDAGKTSLMDLIRNTEIQNNEVGGITQSIGSSFVPIEHVRSLTRTIKGKLSVPHNIPGLLIIDTPGHCAFNNMRDRGSSLCDIAIVVIDIFKGVQPQTIESISMLKEKNVPFVIVANKIDRIDSWEDTGEVNLRKTLKKHSYLFEQTLSSMIEDIKYELMNYEINSEYFLNNSNLKSTYSIIPISTKSREGIPDLLSLIVFISQNWMDSKITYRDNLNATVMETNLDNKNGWTIDLILKNGTINIGDRLVVTSSEGINISTVRNLLLPPDLKQKIKNNDWMRVDSVRASRGVRVIGSNLDNVLSGTRVYRIDDRLSEESAIERASEDIQSYWNRFDWNSSGVYLLAQTFGELDAGYNILREENINILRGDIGNISIRHIENYLMLIEQEELLENRVFMYFHSNEITESKLEEINQLCQIRNIRFIHNQVIYQLVSQYNHIRDELVNDRKNKLISSGTVSFPCKLKILKDHIYLRGGDDDFLLGVRVLVGKLKSGTVLVSDDSVELGEVMSIEKNNDSVLEADERDEVCIRIRNDNGLYYGRHVNFGNKLYSRMDREIIDKLKRDYRDDMKKEWWLLIKDELKPFFNIK